MYNLILAYAKRITGNRETDKSWRQDFVRICSHAKNYEDPLVRGDKNIEKYRFYDEREWRYIPGKEELNGAPASFTDTNHLSDKETHNSKLNDMRLEFSFADMSYLIVKEENEIPEITNHLRNVYAQKCNVIQMEVLLTKIITVSQIDSDF